MIIARAEGEASAFASQGEFLNLKFADAATWKSNDRLTTR